MTQELDTWRHEIRAIDGDLIELIVRRMELALKIGEYKALHKLPVQDHRVEKEVIERSRAMATALGICPDFIEGLMTQILKHSVSMQSRHFFRE